MQALGIELNEKSYASIVSAYAKRGDLEMVEALMLEVEQKGLTVGKQIYNGLIIAYSKNGDPLNAEKVIREMKEKGLEPDVVNYTSLIVAYKKVNNIRMCWQIYDDMQPHLPYDEFLTSYMMKLCAATHDAEKAIKLWNLL